MDEITRDLKARETAVDVTRSVIVQAPAGSGKTSLLTERLLGLLATVSEPEEILAMTFTRKAAAEMRRRVLDYLRMDSSPEEAHEHAVWLKARVLVDKVKAWGLLDNPSRLQIMTLDSFNASLARLMPVLSGLGTVPAVTENARSHYRQAARRTLAVPSDDIKILLRWLDNNTRLAEDLIAALLPAREQWLRVLKGGHAPDRERLEAGLRALVEDELQRAQARLTRGLFAAGLTPARLWELARFGAGHLPEKVADSDLKKCLAYETLPEPVAGALDAWQALAWLLLVKNKPALRKQVNVNQGFPAKTAEKDAMMALLQALPDDCAETFGRIRTLTTAYDDGQWQVLAALVKVLQRAAGELELVFSEVGQMDFPGLAGAAGRALGEVQAPTDLGLYLDYRIRHILVDEFQDTNWNQYYQLEKLTAGWSPGDGRTLFLVGDPMQSIYRFREAEVGLFVKVRDQGLGDIRPESVRLSRNFRARAELVSWVNEHIGPAFPSQDDAVHGQVSYATSVAGRSTGGEIVTHFGLDRDRHEEAAELVELIRATLADTPDHYRIAVLVRSRTHLEALLPALKHAGIAYRALKLDRLTERPVVQDLLALTRAIWHPADRAGALAVLRAPWCGLTLDDLLRLAEADTTLRTVASLLEDDIRLAALSPDGRARAQRLAQVLGRARALWRKRPLRDLVEGAWTALGGPELCAGESERQDAAGYLHQLSAFEQAGDVGDWLAFEEFLADRRAEGRGQARLEVLTIHEAKGLEWDMVILPSLERISGRTERKLLHWFSRSEAHGEQLLIAPLRAAWQPHDGALIETIKLNEKRLEAGERRRLLYVAATRARERLVISGNLKRKDDAVRPLADTSLLADLWPTLQVASCKLQVASDQGPATGAQRVIDQKLRRVCRDWSPARFDAIAWKPQFPPREITAAVTYDWAGLNARRLGRVIHRLLEHIGRMGCEAVDDQVLQYLEQRVPVLLRAEGVAPSDMESSQTAAAEALETVLGDRRGRWILSNRHAQAACELPVGGIIAGHLFNGIVDRTFIDAGTRWIIDYKSSSHEGGSLEAFLAAEAERHGEQLRNYETLFKQMGEADVRTALYFPGLGRWLEISRN